MHIPVEEGPQKLWQREQLVPRVAYPKNAFAACITGTVPEYLGLYRPKVFRKTPETSGKFALNCLCRLNAGLPPPVFDVEYFFLLVKAGFETCDKSVAVPAVRR